MEDRDKQRPDPSEGEAGSEEAPSKGQYGGLTHGLGYGGGRDIDDLTKPDEETPKPQTREK
jgi:hypothetical protein